MRVVQIGKFYAPALGGIETVVRNLSEGLAARGNEVTVLCSGHPGVKPNEMRECIDGVQVHRVRRFGSLLSQPIVPGVFSDLASLSQRADLIHIHTPNPLAEAALAILPKTVPVIVTYHSDVIRQKWLAPLYLPVLNRLLSRADQIVVPTMEHIEFSPVLQRFQSKCTIIPFGIDQSLYTTSDEVLKKSLALQSRIGRYALFVGRMVRYKGVEFLLKAAKDRSISIVLVGSGPEMENNLRLTRELGIENRVHFVGEIRDQNEFLAYFHGCEFFVLPSIGSNEAFGMVLLEAMACAKPMISTRLNSGVRFVNEHGVTGIQVNPMDSEELASAIDILSSSLEMRQRMGEAASQRLKKIFSLEQMVSSYLSLYQQYCPKLKITQTIPHASVG